MNQEIRQQTNNGRQRLSIRFGPIRQYRQNMLMGTNETASQSRVHNGKVTEQLDVKLVLWEKYIVYA